MYPFKTVCVEELLCYLWMGAWTRLGYFLLLNILNPVTLFKWPQSGEVWTGSPSYQEQWFITFFLNLPEKPETLSKKMICWQATVNSWKGGIWVGSFILFWFFIYFIFFFSTESIRLIFMPNWNSILWRGARHYMHGGHMGFFFFSWYLFGRMYQQLHPQKGL